MKAVAIILLGHCEKWSRGPERVRTRSEILSSVAWVITQNMKAV
jgi:hypothetical protein